MYLYGRRSRLRAFIEFVCMVFCMNGLMILSGCQSTKTYEAKSIADGEFDSEGFSGIFLQLHLRGLIKRKHPDAEVKFTFKNLENDKLVMFTQSITKAEDELVFWQLPTGSYEMQSISIEDTEYKTPPEFGYKIYTRDQSLSNLGEIWLRSKRKTTDLYVRRKKLIYPQLRAEFGFPETTDIINGYNGRRLRLMVAERKAEEMQTNEQGENGERERAQVRVKLKERDKKVIMFPDNFNGYVTKVKYRVKIKDQAEYADQVAEAIAAQESEIQKCYIRSIDGGNSFKGVLSYKFWFKKDEPKLNRIVSAGRNRKQKTLNRCLIKVIRGAELSSPEDLDGRLHIKFSMKAH